MFDIFNTVCDTFSERYWTQATRCLIFLTQCAIHLVRGAGHKQRNVPAPCFHGLSFCRGHETARQPSVPFVNKYRTVDKK